MTEQNYQETARDLAIAHKQEDPDTHTVYLAPDPSEQEVRLVEISASAPTSGSVLPVRFRPTKDVLFPSVVVLLSEQEWHEMKKGRLNLPDGWGRLEDLKAI